MGQKRKIWSLSLAVMIMCTPVVPTLAQAKSLESLAMEYAQGVNLGASVKVTTPKKPVVKAVPEEVKKALDIATKYLLKNVSTPQFGSIGGEWAVFGLARRGVEVPKGYYDKYYKHIEQITKAEHGKKSRKWKTKVTETQRLAIAVAAMGKDPTNVNGVNLIDYSFNKGKNMSDLPKDSQPLGNRQGLNELTFGLIAMDLKNTPQPAKAEITRDQIINKIIKDYTTPDGGFSLSDKGTSGEIDITAMTVQALAPYYKQKGYEHVTKSVDKALSFLSKKQNTKGGFVDSLSLSGNKVEGSAESTVQVIVALCSLGINPETDNRFIKNGRTLIDELLSYQLSSGGFEHVKGQGVNQMATEQGYYGLVAYERLLLGKSPIYDMVEME